MSLLVGWEQRAPGLIACVGLTKAERRESHYVRSVDARGGRVRIRADDGRGVPGEIVILAISQVPGPWNGL